MDLGNLPGLPVFSTGISCIGKINEKVFISTSLQKTNTSNIRVSCSVNLLSKHMKGIEKFIIVICLIKMLKYLNNI